MKTCHRRTARRKEVFLRVVWIKDNVFHKKFGQDKNNQHPRGYHQWIVTGKLVNNYCGIKTCTLVFSGKSSNEILFKFAMIFNYIVYSTIMIIFIIIALLNKYALWSYFNSLFNIIWCKIIPVNNQVSYIPRFLKDNDAVLIQLKLEPCSDF